MQHTCRSDPGLAGHGVHRGEEHSIARLPRSAHEDRQGRTEENIWKGPLPPKAHPTSRLIVLKCYWCQEAFPWRSPAVAQSFTPIVRNRRSTPVFWHRQIHLLCFPSDSLAPVFQMCSPRSPKSLPSLCLPHGRATHLPRIGYSQRSHRPQENFF